MASVVFMGTPDFAEGILEALIGSEYEVKAVFTQPDRPKGRKGILQAPPVKVLAQEHGIEVFQPERIRKGDSAQILEQIRPDFIVVAAFGQIIPKNILDIPRYGCLNVHASLLPKWRGAAPIQWSILNGDSESGVTIMQMAEGLDTGDIITQSVVPISDTETGDSLFDKLMISGRELLLDTMRLIEQGKAQYTPQPEESTTPYAKMLTRESGLIDWTQDAVSIERRIRALTSWPGTYSGYNGKLLKIWKAEVRAEEGAFSKAAQEGRASMESQAAPGTIVTASKNELAVQTGKGLLFLTEVQPEGKKRMQADAFLRGYHLQEGDVLSR